MESLINFEHAPLSFLTSKEREKFSDNLNMFFAKNDEVIIKKGELSEKVFFIIKGIVVEADPQEGESLDSQEHIYSYYVKDDLFGHREIKKEAGHNFAIIEESILGALPSKIFLELQEENKTFAAYFRKFTNQLSEDTDHPITDGTESPGRMKIREFEIHTPKMFEVSDSVKDVAESFLKESLSSVLVRKGEETGIITKTDLIQWMVKYGNEFQSKKLGDVINFREPVTVHPESFISEAMIKMTEHNIERVIVKDHDSIKGMLDLKDLLYAFSDMSFSIGLKVNEARSTDQLVRVSKGIKEMANSLMTRGTPIRQIAQMIGALNESVIKRVLELTLPEEVLQNTVFFVMGSEGRREQILKTDQDNGVIVASDFEWPDKEKDLNGVTENLLRLGYPLCKGNIMVSNPYWSGSYKEWDEKVHAWGTTTDPEEIMRIAIFADSRAVAGQSKLLHDIKSAFYSYLDKNPIFYRSFVQAALQFSSPLTFFNGIKNHSEGIDLKKGGIFPIVHGIRTLALQEKIQSVSTFNRIEKLNEKDIIKKELAQDLADSLEAMLEIRLKQRLERILMDDHNSDNFNKVDINIMSRIERDRLRNALLIAKEFKQFLEDRYMLS